MSGTEYDIEMLIKGSWEYQFSKGDQFYAETNAQTIAQSRHVETRVTLNDEVIAQFDKEGKRLSGISG
jgi:ADP-dependent phosphofructokinase/glucokinase